MTRTRAKRNGAFAEFGYKGIASSLAASGCDSVCALTLACKLVVRVKIRIWAGLEWADTCAESSVPYLTHRTG